MRITPTEAVQPEILVTGCTLRVAASVFFFFKQKTAYEIRPRDWSSDVCSSDLCADINADAAQATANDIGAAGLPLQVDVADPAANQDRKSVV